MKKILLLSPFLFLSALAQPAKPDYAGIVQAHHDFAGFMGTVVVLKDQKILFQKAVGKASLEHQVPMQNQSVLAAGSITKSFTAAAILKLQEAGKLHVKDPLSKHLPDFPNGENITLEQLLTHTSGIGGLEDVEDFDNLQRHTLSLDQTLGLFWNKKAHFAPGNQFEYSNAGYLLLSKVIEVRSGQTYPAYLQQQILQPLGFRHTGFHSRTDVVQGLASGYTFDGTQHLKAGSFDPELPSGGGSLYATAPELAHWLPLLHTGKILRPESVERMVTGKVPVGEGFRYAYGLQTRTQGRQVWLHGGAISGYQAMMVYFPEEKLSIVVLSNVGNSPVDQLALTLSSAFFAEPYTLPQKRAFVELDTSVLERYQGSYPLPGLNLTLVVLLKDGILQLQDPMGNFYPLQAVNETTFHQGTAGVDLVFSPDGQKVRLIQGGQTFEGERNLP